MDLINFTVTVTVRLVSFHEQMSLNCLARSSQPKTSRCFVKHDFWLHLSVCCRSTATYYKYNKGIRLGSVYLSSVCFCMVVTLDTPATAGLLEYY